MTLPKFTGYVQAVLTVVFIVGYFIILYLMLTGNVGMNEATREYVGPMVLLLTASVSQVMYFWFQRSRTQSKDDEDDKR